MVPLNLCDVATWVLPIHVVVKQILQILNQPIVSLFIP